MNFIAKVLAHCIVKMRGEKKERKFLVADILDNPEDFVLTAYIEKDELFVRVKRKEKKDGVS